MATAFALRADYEDKFLGGTLNIDGQSVNLKERLDEGNGVIVVEDTQPLLYSALKEYPALKQVPLVRAEEARLEVAQDGPDESQNDPAPRRGPKE